MTDGVIDPLVVGEPVSQLPAAEWLDIIQAHYIDDYIREGGASVKVVVAEPELRAKVSAELMARAERSNFLTASVDSRTCKVHLIHNLFHQIAETQDWLDLAGAIVRRGLNDRGYPVAPATRIDLQEVADQHGLDLVLMRRELNRMLTERIYHSPELPRELRLAGLQLCLAASEGTDQAVQMGQNVTDWLCGRLRLISMMKSALIFQKINRHNARSLLTSLGAFAHLSGRAGIMAIIDVSRYLEASPDPQEGLRYSKGATVEVYEVMRQFIDGTDEMVNTMLVFLTGPAFQTDEQRGMRVYDALRLRLYDDVRDRSRPNPLSPMVALV